MYLQELGDSFKGTFGDKVLTYRPSVDVILVLLDASIIVECLLFVLNRWKAGEIVVTKDMSESLFCTCFLDVLLSIDKGLVNLGTYRKPINVYQHTPFNSNHSRKTLLEIIHTEAIRCLRTSQVEEHFEFEKTFFPR